MTSGFVKDLFITLGEGNEGRKVEKEGDQLTVNTRNLEQSSLVIVKSKVKLPAPKWHLDSEFETGHVPPLNF